MTRRVLLHGAVAGGAVALVAAAGISGLSTSPVAPLAKEVTPVPVSKVPVTLPARGVQVNRGFVLQPLTVVPKKAMSAAEAIRASHAYVKSQPSPPKALEANFSARSSLINGVPAWIVTYTSPKPTNVSTTGVPAFVRHFSVALDATTGKFLVGFFTK